MNQRVHNLSKWRLVPEGTAVRYPGTKRRTVIIDVNCPGEVCFWVVQDREAIESDPERLSDIEAGRTPPPGDDPYSPVDAANFNAAGPVTFLALVKGRDRLEFGVDGPFELVAMGGPAYVFTVDGQDTMTRILAPEIFTRIANRRQRNPHLELIEYQMRLNQQRFAEQLEHEIERRTAALEQKLESYAPQRDQRAPAERSWPPRVSEAVAEDSADSDVDGAAERTSEAEDEPDKGSARKKAGRARAAESD